MRTFSKAVRTYIDPAGNKPFEDWLNSLKDIKGRAIIRQRINRLRTGNAGNYRHITEEIYELKIQFGPGYRVCFAEWDNIIVVLLCGGDKSSQKRDIKKAKEYWKELGRRINE